MENGNPFENFEKLKWLGEEIRKREEKLKSIEEEKKDNSQEIRKREEKLKLIEEEKKDNSQEKIYIEIFIEELNLSTRAYNCLRRRGYNTVEDLLKAHENDLLKIQNMGPKSVKEIMEKIEPYREEYEAEQQRKIDEQKKLEIEETRQKIIDGTISIENLNLSTRAYTCLVRGGYRTVENLIGLTEKDLLKIRNLGIKSAEEIIKKLEPYRKMLEAEGTEKEEPIEPESLEEVKVEENPIEETEQKSTDLQSVKAKKDELQERISQLKLQMSKAQALLDECNEILGENKEDKKPNLDD